MTKDEQIAYLWDVIDKLNTLAYDRPDSPHMDYVKRLTTEAMRKVPRPLEVVPCPDCDGTGYAAGRWGHGDFDGLPCATCDGLGSVEVN